MARHFVLSPELAVARRPLRDAATLMLDCGLRISELLQLTWADVRLNGSGLGYINVTYGKSKKPRVVSMSPKVLEMLTARQGGAFTVCAMMNGKPYRVEVHRLPFMFTGEDGSGPLSIATLEDQHRRAHESTGSANA